MVYGVESKTAESPPQPPKVDAPPSADPWHGAASAADPWAASPGLPGAAAAPSDAAWPDSSAAWASYTSPEYGGELDAFGKGKGKGKDSGARPPLECYNCLGTGHPQRLCPTPPGMGGKPGAEVCSNCRGKGHSAPFCTSKGGGKHEQPDKGKGKDGGKGYGKPGG